MTFAAALTAFAVLAQLAEPQGLGSKSSGRAASIAPWAPPVVDWGREVSLPDDLLFTRHRPGGGSLIFLASFDAMGNVTTVRPIAGYSLYLKPVGEQIKQSAHLPDRAGKAVVIRVPDPLDKYITDYRSFRGQKCTPSTELRRLYELGAYLQQPEENGDAAACYRYILERNPSSLAGRWGLEELCRAAKRDGCGPLTQGVVDSNPDFVEARMALVRDREARDGYQAYNDGVEDLLSRQDVALAERAGLLDLEVFTLTEHDNLDGAIPVIGRWKSAIAELFQIYPPAFRYGVQIFKAALLEESRGLTGDSIISYRLAASDARYDHLVPESQRYAIDLGLARTLRRAGDAREAKVLCDGWVKRRDGLVHRPPRARWEGWEDGRGEVEGRWEFSCGSPEKGLQLIEEAMRKYPESYAAPIALSEYYYSAGDPEKAKEAAATSSRLMLEWGHRLGEF